MTPSSLFFHEDNLSQFFPSFLNSYLCFVNNTRHVTYHSSWCFVRSTSCWCCCWLHSWYLHFEGLLPTSIVLHLTFLAIQNINYTLFFVVDIKLVVSFSFFIYFYLFIIIRDVINAHFYHRVSRISKSIFTKWFSSGLVLSL
jgi:hypothetical protein